MQSTLLPKGTCDDIDKLCRAFVWGDDQDTRHMHLVNWNQLCQYKRNGGLGLRNSKLANKAFMMKVNWDLCNNVDSLWVKLIRGKYKCGADGFPRIKKNSSCSNIWHAICQTWEEFRNMLTWDIGNGEDARFWIDYWMPNLDDTIINCVNPNEEINLENKVSEFVNPNGVWDSNKMQDYVPEDIVQKIISLPVPLVSNGPDVYRWKASADGAFSTRSAYQMLLGDQPHRNNKTFHLVWKWKGPERVKIFLWKLAHGNILTNQERRRRHLTEDAQCPFCNNSEESLLHLFRDCRRAAQIWLSFPTLNIQNFWFETDWNNWMSTNLKAAVKKNEIDINCLRFGVTLDWLWRARNDLVFSRKVITTTELRVKIAHGVQCIQNSLNLASVLLQNANQMKFGSDGVISVPDGFVMIHCDGSAALAGRRCGCGGIVRGADKCFQLAFSCGLRGCSVLECEIWAIYYAIKLGLEKGKKKMVICSDSIEALLQVSEGSRSTSLALVKDILNMVGGDCEIRWCHVPREFNLAADCLASCNLSPNVRNIYDYIPPHLATVLDKEMAEGVGPIVA